MAKQPRLTGFGVNSPWASYIQREVDGPWFRKLFLTYSEGYRWVSAHINDFHDLTLNCRRQGFKPPIIRSQGKLAYRLPQLSMPPDAPHIWCPYCRRLSIFKPFARHHALGIIGRSGRFETIPIRYLDRCTICGIRLEAIERYT